MWKIQQPNADALRGLHSKPLSWRRGFTLVELLTVISIAVIMSYLVIPGLVSVSPAASLKSNTIAVGDLLEQAYSSALSKNTYVWVGVSQVTVNGVSGVAMASVYSAHENPADFSTNTVLPLTRPVFLPHMTLATVASQITNSNKASVSVEEITSATMGALSTQISGSTQTLSNVMEITPSGQVFVSPTNKYAWMEIGLAPTNSNGKDVSMLQMNAFTGRVSIYQP
jgi:prepilin-type N-terminal cleavage/methylation domain-containing protein